MVNNQQVSRIESSAPKEWHYPLAQKGFETFCSACLQNQMGRCNLPIGFFICYPAKPLLILTIGTFFYHLKTGVCTSYRFGRAGMFGPHVY